MGVGVLSAGQISLCMTELVNIGVCTLENQSKDMPVTGISQRIATLQMRLNTSGGVTEPARRIRRLSNCTQVSSVGLHVSHFKHFTKCNKASAV